MTLRQQWYLWNNAQKVAFSLRYPEEERCTLLDSLIFPETERETHEFVDVLYEQEAKRRGIKPKWMEQNRSASILVELPF